MDGKLGAVVGEGVEAVDIVETFLILSMTAFNPVVVPWGEGGIDLRQMPTSTAVSSMSVGKSRLEAEKRLVNSKQLSVCTHSIRTPSLANLRTTILRKSAEEKVLCAS